MSLGPLHGSSSVPESGGSKKTIKNSAEAINKCVQKIGINFDPPITFTRFSPKKIGSSIKLLDTYMNKVTQILRENYAGEPLVENNIKELITTLKDIQLNTFSNKSKTIETIIEKLNKIINFQPDPELDAGFNALQDEVQNILEDYEEVRNVLGKSIIKELPEEQLILEKELEELMKLQENQSSNSGNGPASDE